MTKKWLISKRYIQTTIGYEDKNGSNASPPLLGGRFTKGGDLVIWQVLNLQMHT
jgi:hypothetical protein